MYGEITKKGQSLHILLEKGICFFSISNLIINSKEFQFFFLQIIGLIASSSIKYFLPQSVSVDMVLVLL
jgi:hypothetical protein